MSEPTAEHLRAAQERLRQHADHFLKPRLGSFTIKHDQVAADIDTLLTAYAFLASREQALRMAVDRIREHWPHIEVGIKGRTHDPGSPTCLRCTIEKEIADAGAV